MGRLRLVKSRPPAQGPTASHHPAPGGQEGPSFPALRSCGQASASLVSGQASQPLPSQQDPCPQALFRLMQPLSRLLGCVLLPFWLNPLTWPSMGMTVCQAMGTCQGSHKRQLGQGAGLISPIPLLYPPPAAGAALATPGHPVPADRHSWAPGPVAELKLDPVLHVGYQGQLSSGPGCSRCGGPGGLLVLVPSHPAGCLRLRQLSPSSSNPRS